MSVQSYESPPTMPGWIQKLSETVFGPQPASAAKAPDVQVSAKTSGVATSAAETEAFEARLIAVLNQSRGLRPGMVILLDLAKIIERLNTTSTGIPDRFDTIVQTVLDERMDVGDRYLRLETTRYLILFGSVVSEDGERRAASIAADIARRLLPDPRSPALIQIRTIFSEGDDGLKVKEIPPEASLLDTLVETLTSAPVEQAEEPLSKDPFDRLQLVYRPMWDVQKGVVSTYISVPAVRYPGGGLMVGERHFPEIEDEAVAARLDRVVLQRVSDELTTMIEEGRRLIIGIPIHFSTLAASATRVEYLRLCQGIPQLAHRFVIFEIIGTPEGAPQSRLLELSTTLRRYARAVIARMPLDSRLLKTLGGTGLLAVGIEMTQANAEQTTSDRLAAFAAAAQQAGLSAYVHGLKTLSLTSTAVGAGFRYIDGDTVEKFVNLPRRVYRFSPADLYEKLLANRKG
jgi:hypothetical protein